MRRLVTVLVVAGLVCIGCARPTHLHETWGEAQRANREAMVANPDAGTGPGVVGLDPRSAEHVLDNYSEGQEAQQHERSKRRMTQGIVIGEMD